MSFLSPQPNINIQPVNKPAPQITNHPRITGVDVQTNSAGLVIPVIYGTARIAPNVIDWALSAVPYEGVDESGNTETGYIYYGNFYLSIGHGPLPAQPDTNRHWNSGNPFSMEYFPPFTGELWTFYDGNLNQVIPGYSNNLRGLSLYYVDGWSLGVDQINNPSFSFEISGFLVSPGLQDANPGDILVNLLVNPVYGAGFPAANLNYTGGGYFGGAPGYMAYCIAQNLWMSPVYDNQRPLAEIISEILAATNSAPVWSQGILNIVPYGDTVLSDHGITYIPVMTPQYDLTDDDFEAPEGTPPVTMVKKRQSDIFNSVKMEYLNRDNGYSPDVVIASDLLSINLYGLREAPSQTAHFFANGDYARNSAQLYLQRMLKVRTQYKFNLTWRFIGLDPMDLVTLTDSNLGLARQLVRIIEIDEDEDGTLSITSEEVPFCASSPFYGHEANPGYIPPYNQAAPNNLAALIFEPPDLLAKDINSPEIWMAISGPENWGGCDIYYSEDNVTYTKIGFRLGNSTMGHLTTAINPGDSSVSVALTSDNQILSVTEQDYQRLNALCLIDNEIIAFQNSTLTGNRAYTLTPIARGAYDTGAGNHAINAPFAVITDNVFKFPYRTQVIGSTVFFKFVSWNTYGGGKQSIIDVDPASYMVTGSALFSPLPDLANIKTAFVDGSTVISWDPITDFRSPISYEIRLGPSWDNAIVLGTTPNTSWPYYYDGTYWIASRWSAKDSSIFSDLIPNRGVVYSDNPAELVISGGAISLNIHGETDEKALGWPGNKVQMAVNSYDGGLYLDAAGNILTVASFLGLTDVLFYGGIYSSGSYEVAGADWITLAAYTKGQVMISYSFQAINIHDNFLALPNVLTVTDLLGAQYTQFVTITPQVALKDQSGVWGDYQDFIPGWQLLKGVKARILVSVSIPEIKVDLTGFTLSLNLPDIVQSGLNVSINAAGQTLVFNTPYNAIHNVQVTILNSQAGDIAVIDPAQMTTAGFNIQIINGGSGVSRSINWFSSGY